MAREIERAFPGWSVDGITGGGHLRLRHASGAIYFSAATPSDRRGWRNLRSQLRRLADAPTRHTSTKGTP
jgi:hypothetical protein